MITLATAPYLDRREKRTVRPGRRLAVAVLLAVLLVGGLGLLSAGYRKPVDDATAERLRAIVRDFTEPNGLTNPIAWAVERTKADCTLPFDGSCALPGEGPIAYVIVVRGAYVCRTCSGRTTSRASAVSAGKPR